MRRFVRPSPSFLPQFVAFFRIPHPPNSLVFDQHASLRPVRRPQQCVRISQSDGQPAPSARIALPGRLLCDSRALFLLLLAFVLLYRSPISLRVIAGETVRHSIESLLFLRANSIGNRRSCDSRQYTKHRQVRKLRQRHVNELDRRLSPLPSPPL